MDNPTQTLTRDAAVDVVRRRRDAALALKAAGRLDPAAVPALRDYAFLKADGGLGLADAEAKLVSADESRASAKFLISTAKRDRQGDVVVPKGLEPHLANYLRNPRVFFGHRSHGLPIGSARDRDGNPTVRVFDDRIEAEVFFNLLTEESELVYRFVAARELEATSIGFLPVKARLIKRPQQDDDDKSLLFDWGGLIFDEWDLTEFSVVPVPANPDAVNLWLANGVGGKQLPPSLRKAFEPYARPQNVWAPGWDFPDDGSFPAQENGAAQENVETKSADDMTPAGGPVPASAADPQVPPANAVVTDVTGCARCGGDHKGLAFTPLTHAAGEWTHWAPCPASQEPVLLRKDPAPEAPAETPAPEPAKDHVQPAPAAPAPQAPPAVPYGLTVCRQVECILTDVDGDFARLLEPLEQEKVRKAVEKLRKRLAEHCEEVCDLAREVYPDHFQEGDGGKAAPAPRTDGLPPASLPTPPAPTPDFDQAVVLAALDALNAASRETADALYRLTGKR